MKTPKTLLEAIRNGMLGVPSQRLPSTEIEKHVRDFISQKFATAMLETENVDYENKLMELFKTIVRQDD